MPTTADLLPLSDAAAYLGVPPRTLRDWASKGRIPYHLTPGGRRLYARADLDAAFSRVESSPITAA